MQVILYLGIGLTIGTVSGALGIGGGVLLVPALIWLCGLEPRVAAGTSLAIFVLPVFLPAAWKFHSGRYLDLPAALWIAAAFGVGGYVGASLRVSHVLPEDGLRLVFGLLMIYVAVRFIVNADSETANAAAGLIAVALAWTGYLGLRLLGRRHLRRPDLGEKIRLMEEQGRGDPEYHI